MAAAAKKSMHYNWSLSPWYTKQQCRGREDGRGVDNTEGGVGGIKRMRDIP